ncbi:hypothetical protein F5Y14DRAFT_234982 [Nemania sp. NC0429]|nr:hypothetical protein F5Y14DRAFT_234982 [Nemania sp. NC0429]
MLVKYDDGFYSSYMECIAEGSRGLMPLETFAFACYQSVNQSIRTGSPTVLWLLWLDSDRGVTGNMVVDDMFSPCRGLPGMSGITGRRLRPNVCIDEVGINPACSAVEPRGRSGPGPCSGAKAREAGRALGRRSYVTSATPEAIDQGSRDPSSPASAWVAFHISVGQFSSWLEVVSQRYKVVLATVGKPISIVRRDDTASQRRYLVEKRG